MLFSDSLAVLRSSKNIWVLQTSFVGDCILTLPLLARLLELAPHATVHVICNAAGAALFNCAGQRGLAVNAARLKVHRFNKRHEHRGWLRAYKFAQHIKKESGVPEIVFCAQRSFRSGALALLSGARRRVGFSSGAVSYFYTHLARRDWNNGRSEIEKNLDLLRAFLGEDNEDNSKVKAWDSSTAPSLLAAQSPAALLVARSPTNMRAAEKNVAAAFSPAASEKPVLLSLGSPWATKRWTHKNAVDLCRRLTLSGIQVILIGDEAAKEQAQLILNEVKSLLLENHCGKTDVVAWVDQIATAQVLVSGDSAAVHLASDLGVPVLALFGPTSPDFGFAPWRKGSLAIGVKDLACRPCHIHGPRRCPLGHHKCMNELSADLVFSQLKRFLPHSGVAFKNMP